MALLKVRIIRIIQIHSLVMINVPDCTTIHQTVNFQVFHSKTVYWVRAMLLVWLKNCQQTPVQQIQCNTTQTHTALVNIEKVKIKQVSMNKKIFTKQTEADETMSTGYLPRRSTFKSIGITRLKTEPCSAFWATSWLQVPNKALTNILQT